MINPTGKKLEKLLFGMFDDAIQDVDRYNHNGNLWLIFTDELRWVVEYTKSQTLWYNFYFFKQEMEMVGLDCVENKDLIQKWFESRFLNINPVEDTIQNGVKHTEKSLQIDGSCVIEDTVQNGVKNTYSDKIPHEYDWSDQFTEEIEDTIQNGVKEIYEITYQFIERVEDTIKSGVKKILSGDDDYDYPVRDTIQNGVKHIGLDVSDCKDQVEDTIQNGVKHTKSNVHPYPKEVRDTIQNGVKETCKSESTKSISLRRTIQNGVKNTNEAFYGQVYVENTVQNGVKHCEDGDWLDGDKRFEDIIQNGEKK